jgi:hypothetical protein
MTQKHVGSVLGLCSTADVDTQPYAHIVTDAPYEPALYDRLAESFPPTDWFLGGLDDIKSNQAVRIPAYHVINNEKFSPEWQEFFRYHTSQEFWGDIVRVFGDSLRATYPDLESRAGLAFEDWRVKRRNESGEAQVSLDLLFVINTAVVRSGSVRPPHVDDEKKIFSGLFYMKPDDDPTPGGDLAIYKTLGTDTQFGGHYVEDRQIEQTGLVKYAANRFIGFVNSDRSIHGVTSRPVTPHIRRYINFVAETPFGAFHLPKLPLHRKLLFKVRNRMHKAPGVTLTPENRNF